MKNLILSILFISFSNSMLAGTNYPDSTYCLWYDISIEFWENQNRRYYEYNEIEQVTSEILQFWNAAINDWENQIKYITNYNDQNLISEYIIIDWNDEWIVDRHQTFEYNTNGLVTEWKYQLWNQAWESWTGGEKYNYEYNSGNKEITKIFSEWSTGENDFIEVNKWLSTYEDNLLTIRIFQEMGSTIWENKYRYVYTYDENKLLLSNVKQNWNSAVNRWESDSKTVYTYDENGNIIEKTDLFWNHLYELWENETRYIYEFERDSLLILEERQYWYNEEEWLSEWKNKISYNSYGLRTELVSSLFSEVTMEWHFHTKNIFNYNDSNELSENIAQDWNENLNDWLNNYKTSYTGNQLMRTELFENWDSIRNDWVYENKCIDYYSWPASIHLNIKPKNELVIFPNPVANKIQLASNNLFQEVIIYSMDGKITKTLQEYYPQSIDINQLATGKYFIIARDINDEYYWGNFIKN